MAVYKKQRANGTFQWYAKLGKKVTGGRPKSLKLSSKIRTIQQAHAAEIKLIKEITRTRGKNLEPSVCDVAGNVLREVDSKCTRATFRNCKGYLNAFLDFFDADDIPMSHIVIEDCLEYRDARLSGWAPTVEDPQTGEKKSLKSITPTTLLKELRFLKRVFKLGVSMGVIMSNPWDHVKMPSENPFNPKPMTIESFHLLCAMALPERRLRYKFLLYTGCDVGQAMKVTWADIDFKNKMIRLQSRHKGRAPKRQVYYVPLVKDLEEELQHCGLDHIKYFIGYRKQN